MFLRPKESLRLSIYSLKRCIGVSNRRDFHLTHFAYLRSVSSGRRKVAEVRDSESSPSVAGEFSVSVTPKNVNDNFFGIESDEGVIEVNSKPSLDNNATGRIFRNVEQEKFFTTTYGTVRYDSENKPKYHGQLEKGKLLISSNVDKDKIHNLNQALLKKNSVENRSVSSLMEKSAKTTTNIVDRNLKSKLPSSSYVDELYFPVSYTEKENNINSKLESLPSSSNDDELNFIEESYFGDKISSDSTLKNDISAGKNCYAEKNYSLPGHEESTESIADKKLSSFHSMPGLKSSPSSSIDKKSSYFNGKMADESICNSVNMTSENIGNTGKNHPSLVHEKSTDYIADDKQSSVFDDQYFHSISNNNLKNIDNVTSEYVERTVYTIEEKSNEENSTIPLKTEKNEELFISESESDVADSEVTTGNAKLSTENLFNTQEIETNIKSMYSLNKNNEEIDADYIGEQFSLELNNPNLEELEGYNKFISNATNLPKKKNDFSFQSKDFLKKTELINSKSLSRLKKLRLVQRNLDETDVVEETQNEEEVIKGSLETLNLKVKKEADVKDSKANEQPETAYDFVKKLRSTKKKSDPELINGKFIQKTEQHDSKGFRILKNQVPDLSNFTRDEILELLVKNVLYSDDDVIVLNKPYNLVMHESKTAKDPCLSQYLEDLAAEMDRKTYKPKLITVHRLDKETTGCLLLARNEISAQRLLSFFSQRKIIKTYWIVTTRVPDPLEGVIDIPISEGSINGRARMVLHPNLPKDILYQNHSKKGKRAVTHYKVIAESGNAALVEAKPETGIKHQIRVHFGFGLSCPILGDHKYSHLDKLAPQKLQSDLLQRLHVRQSKVRYIPMHIYARSIFIPQYKDGRNLFVMAPMPIHMSKNLQKLKFKKK